MKRTDKINGRNVRARRKHTAGGCVFTVVRSLHMIRKCKDVDLVLYCVDMTDSRFKSAETRAIGLITKKFGPTIWKRCVFVLTKANLVQASKKMREAVIEYHQNLFKSFQVKLRSVLKDAGVPESVCDGLRVVAAGYFDPDLETNDSVSGRKIVFASEHCKADPGPPIVPVDFIPELWVTCLETMPEASRMSYLQATAFSGNITEPTAEPRMMLEAAAKDLAGKILNNVDKPITYDRPRFSFSCTIL